MKMAKSGVRTGPDSLCKIELDRCGKRELGMDSIIRESAIKKADFNLR